MTDDLRKKINEWINDHINAYNCYSFRYQNIFHVLFSEVSKDQLDRELNSMIDDKLLIRPEKFDREILAVTDEWINNFRRG